MASAPQEIFEGIKNIIVSGFIVFFEWLKKKFQKSDKHDQQGPH
jgi:hypothetical protein